MTLTTGWKEMTVAAVATLLWLYLHYKYARTQRPTPPPRGSASAVIGPPIKAAS